MRTWVATLLAMLVVKPAAAAPIPVTGRWLVTDGSAVVEVAPCQVRDSGAKLCGRIVRVVKPRLGGPATDVKNPDPAQRTQPIKGITILSGFVSAGDRWKGRVYDPDSGRSYRAELLRDGGTLHVKGCLGPFCRTLNWTRVG
ncbi:DUF2147 domain-containing protein [Sphingomonas bacterium]|uniref:DUF2147 domain-containing protein n=1 Tax=Sphingomonas bacterium TaxID=1895847 RepID=UPI0015768E03|nr:DUF2147 domain-containing protein [Sphingomonas bacterium]